jgi:hypothetical protein
VRDPAANHHPIQLAQAVQVIGIATLAAQQDRIFLARHRLANREFLVSQQCRIERYVHQGSALVTLQ